MPRAGFVGWVGGLLACAGLAQAASGPGPDPRERFGSAAARSVEAILSQLQPGSRLEWTSDTVWLVTAEGARRRLLFPGFLRRPVGERQFVATCLEFPEEGERRRRIVASFERPAARSSGLTVAGAWTLADGQLEGVARRLDLPVPGDLAACRTLHFGGVAEPGAWPTMRIAYGSAFSGTDWWGWIDWTAELDLASGRLQGPAPLRASKTWRDGATVSRFLVATSPGAPRDARARALSANPLVLEMVCEAPPCTTDGRALLEGIAR